MGIGRLLAGTELGLGATWDGEGTNFALFSANASRVELCLFDETGSREVARLELPEHTNEVWHGYHPQVKPGQLYGYRVHGPFQPEAGHRFNPNKLLIDPYARSLNGRIAVNRAHRGACLIDDRPAPDPVDSAPVTPKCRVIDPATKGRREIRRPATQWARTVIYEGHPKGLTAQHPDVAPAHRGTVAGLTDPALLSHLKALGVTALELLPLQAFADDAFVLERGLTNYWGYNSICFFAPEPRYLPEGAADATDGGLGHVRALVDRLHEAGIEVLLDVVYNHSAEADQHGPTLSFRGIDNASYYRLPADDPGSYVNHTGTGNTLNTAHPRVIQLIADSLRYWAGEIGVDGFRFDLAAALGREAAGADGGAFDTGAALFDVLAQDPVLSRVKLIAEPWDVGPDGYRLGRFPPGWSEWNDRFRDTVRAFWRGDAGRLPELAARLAGSADIFDRRGRRPSASINFITCHDGFTLRDVVSYGAKHNLANRENNGDGHNENHSANYGVEGPSDDDAIDGLRWRQMRNMAATLLLAQGTPMLLAGDEFGQTQAGNNNAYCQDNPTSWLDWAGTGPQAARFAAFVGRLVALRGRIGLGRRPYLHGQRLSPSGWPDILWLDADGTAHPDHIWHNPDERFLMVLYAADDQDCRTVTIAINANTGAVDCRLPEPPAGGPCAWSLLLDTAAPEQAAGTPVAAGSYGVAGRSLAVFECVPAAANRPPITG